MLCISRKLFLFMTRLVSACIYKRRIPMISLYWHLMAKFEWCIDHMLPIYRSVGSIRHTSLSLTRLPTRHLATEHVAIRQNATDQPAIGQITTILPPGHRHQPSLDNSATQRLQTGAVSLPDTRHTTQSSSTPVTHTLRNSNTLSFNRRKTNSLSLSYLYT